ncbi:TIR domain-containing protein [Sorangium sp. So ce542]|uniref:TIR domain-containing protein n=1 Tax=Sorangium sp. So ce542 TaxID=3133316 RepID=UPI003F61DC90
MARRVFFSFHYENDVWRASVVRNSHVVEGTAAAGFQDASLWEEAKKKGDDALKRLINAGLENTTVTAVLIGAETASRKWVDYEIQRSIERGNGLLGIYIDGLKDKDGKTSVRGVVPKRLSEAGAPVYFWDRDKFGQWVEAAAKKAGK